jgi:hypothetical protein
VKLSNVFLVQLPNFSLIIIVISFIIVIIVVVVLRLFQIIADLSDRAV